MIEKSMILDYPACSDPKVLDLISEYGQKVTIKKGEMLTTPGDNISAMKFIYSGKVKVVMLDTYGYEKILYILHKGWFLREGLFIDNVIKPFAKNYSRAEEDCVIYMIDHNAFDKLKESTDFMLALLRSCAIKRALLANELHNVTFKSAEERVLQLIVSSADRSCPPVDSYWLSLKQQYTHSEMGQILGINRVTVSKIITQLGKEKRLRVVNKKIQVNCDFWD